MLEGIGPGWLDYGYAGILLAVLIAVAAVVRVWLTRQMDRADENAEFTREIATTALADAREINAATIAALHELASTIKAHGTAVKIEHRQQQESLKRIERGLQGGLGRATDS